MGRSQTFLLGLTDNVRAYAEPPHWVKVCAPYTESRLWLFQLDQVPFWEKTGLVHVTKETLPFSCRRCSDQLFPHHLHAHSVSDLLRSGDDSASFWKAFFLGGEQLRGDNYRVCLFYWNPVISITLVVTRKKLNIFCDVTKKTSAMFLVQKKNPLVKQLKMNLTVSLIYLECQGCKKKFLFYK